MNARHMLAALVATTCTVFASGGAWANRLPGDIVTGPITAVSAHTISIQGQSYLISAGTTAASAAARLTPGQVVDVQLDGPASSSASHAIDIVLHTGAYP